MHGKHIRDGYFDASLRVVTKGLLDRFDFKKMERGFEKG